MILHNLAHKKEFYVPNVEGAIFRINNGLKDEFSGFDGVLTTRDSRKVIGVFVWDGECMNHEFVDW